MHCRYIAWLSCLAGVICVPPPPSIQPKGYTAPLYGRPPIQGAGLARPIYLLFLSNYPIGFKWQPNEVTPHLIIGPTVSDNPHSINIHFEPVGTQSNGVPVLFRPYFWQRDQPLPPLFDNPEASGKEFRRGETDSIVFFKLGATTLTDEQILRFILEELTRNPGLSSSHTISTVFQSILAGMMTVRLQKYTAAQEALVKQHFRNADLYQTAVGQNFQRLPYLIHQWGDPAQMTRTLVVLIDPHETWMCDEASNPATYAEIMKLLDQFAESMQ
ncbi:hypothetical protein MMC11_003461 [Xylographa trunciseda]|nr:hypothetical protein [Xylographa trunciseda]